MLTPLGKELRKLRIERGEIIKDMASRLNMSPSYLSSIEIGKRTIPSNFVGDVVAVYQLTEEQARKLHISYGESVEQAKIDLSKANADKRHLALSFARNFDDLSTEEFNRIKSILQKKDEESGYE